MGIRKTVWGLVAAAVLLASVLVVAGCSRGQGIGYGSGYVFTYPSGSVERGWRYRMVVNELSDQGGSSFALTQKSARVSIVDADGGFLLDETYEFGRRAAIEASATWLVPETVTLEVREHGFVNPDRAPRPEDPYNAALVESGGRTLKVITYHLDPSSKQFVAVP